jgi:hypothetical protein
MQTRSARRPATIVPELRAPASSKDVDEDPFTVAARELVGRVGLKQAQKRLRSAMFRVALDRVSGNRRAAARMLGVDRRYVLKLIERDGHGGCPDESE